MSDSDEKDPVVAALQELLHSEGWKIFKAAADAAWGPTGYGYEMRQTLATIPAGPDRSWEIAQAAERVEATAKAVEKIIAWPTEEISRRTTASVPARPFAKLRGFTR